MECGLFFLFLLYFIMYSKFILTHIPEYVIIYHALDERPRYKNICFYSAVLFCFYLSVSLRCNLLFTVEWIRVYLLGESIRPDQLMLLAFVYVLKENTLVFIYLSNYMIELFRIHNDNSLSFYFTFADVKNHSVIHLIRKITIVFIVATKFVYLSLCIFNPADLLSLYWLVYSFLFV